MVVKAQLTPSKYQERNSNVPEGFKIAQTTRPPKRHFLQELGLFSGEGYQAQRRHRLGPVKADVLLSRWPGRRRHCKDYGRLAHDRNLFEILRASGQLLECGEVEKVEAGVLLSRWPGGRWHRKDYGRLADHRDLTDLNHFRTT